jgi:hypothetical protein
VSQLTKKRRPPERGNRIRDTFPHAERHVTRDAMFRVTCRNVTKGHAMLYAALYLLPIFPPLLYILYLSNSYRV